MIVTVPYAHILQRVIAVVPYARILFGGYLGAMPYISTVGDSGHAICLHPTVGDSDHAVCLHPILRLSTMGDNRYAVCSHPILWL